MTLYRLSRLAETDLRQIVATSADRWGPEASRRYANLILAAAQTIAAMPERPTARRRNDLEFGLRSFHLRHVRRTGPDMAVKLPVHVLYYRIVRPGLVEIARILHERMEPGRHLGAANADED